MILKRYRISEYLKNRYFHEDYSNMNRNSLHHPTILSNLKDVHNINKLFFNIVVLSSKIKYPYDHHYCRLHKVFKIH
jgi:hypothetical protein